MATDYFNNLSPRHFQEAYRLGDERLCAFRLARIKFVRAMVGGYYDQLSGGGPAHTLNVIHHAIRILVPNLVMNYPRHIVETEYLEHKNYAELLGLALSYDDKRQRIMNKYTQAIVDAILTLGICKTGLGSSDTAMAINETDEGILDPGQIYTEVVDFDNFVADPNSRGHLFCDAAFIGDKIQIPRRVLLESGLYKNDLVKKLPQMSEANHMERVSETSTRQIQVNQVYDIEDIVEIAEVWVPSANMVVTIPGDGRLQWDKYLRTHDYYGPKEGPYTYLSFSPPVPNNPIPVPLVGSWYDLAVVLNRMAKKTIQQAESQKDIYAYKRSAIDDAISAKDAMDGEGVAMDDPEAVKMISLGGQQKSNIEATNLFMDWYNTFANNPEQVGGFDIKSKTATGANILNQRSNVGLEDMRDKVYIFAAEEAKKRAFYLHTDPAIKLPLNRKVKQPAQNIVGMNGQQIWSMPPHEKEVQDILTPELKSGEFFDFAFTIEPQSMTRLDAQQKLQQESAFFQQILPAVIAAATGAKQIGIAFNVQAALVRYCRDAGITWMNEVVMDPGSAQESAAKAAMGPPPDGNATKQENAKPNEGLMNAQLQNGQPGQTGGGPTPPQMQQNQNAQQGANESQRYLSKAFTHGMSAKPPSFTGN